MAALTQVTISEQGIIKNILSLGYNHQTTVKEYLNNVLSKNVAHDYAININMKDMNHGNLFLFEFEEKNASGFSTMDELVRAFRIADSERSGTNNMGYGIYAPITINKGHDAMGLFIQDNENGRFYSVVHFNNTFNIISTAQGHLEDIKEQDITFMRSGMEHGTKFVWVTFPDRDESDEPTMLGTTDVIRMIRRNHGISDRYGCMDADVEEEIMDLGKYYNHYLQGLQPVSITYGGFPVNGQNILQPDEDKTVRERVYETSIARDTSSQLEYRIRDDSGTLRKFNKSSTKPFSDEPARSRHHGVQEAIVRIYDIDTPNDASENKTRSLDRKMWVKIGETYIFTEDFPLRGHPNIRVVIELTNEGGNEFGYFISPDANKSNSTINPQFKKRLSDLVKYTEKKYFSIDSRKISVPDKLKHCAWETHIGDTLRGECMECFSGMEVWKYDAVLDDSSGEVEVNNILCVCKECGKGAIRE
tara:strand:- start:195 stop:1619 length:1425 start_codon:yes stop_codon:yes gene_type:complete